MKRILSHMFSILSMVLMTIGFSSCISETHTLEDEPEEFNNTTFVLRLNTVNRYSTRADVEPQEKIKTLRIVITDETDQVEINKYFSDVSDRDFYTETENEYIIPGVTPGEKNVYIFANEESVTDISWSYTGEWGVRDLHDLLEGANNMRDDFGSHINSVTFLLNKNNISTSGLPYSASYSNINVEKGKRNEYTCYLVPVCTKFRFKFFNDRSSAVQINSISLSSQAKSTYLMAHVGESDFYKSLPGESEKKYWIDWLYEISNESWNYPDISENEWFNGQASYIKDYIIPNELNSDYKPKDQHSDYTFPDLRPLIASSTSTEFSEMYYVMESKNVNDSGVQKYYLNLNINGVWPQPEPVELKDFPALFRNSFVDIDVLLSGNDKLNISLFYTVCEWENQTSGDITFN